MNNMRVPRRPAPVLEVAVKKLNQNEKLFIKKVPPPRPPPPNFNKSKSRSAWNLNENVEISLIEWSPPSSPKTTSIRQLSGSVSSSFSSSTSSLASSKKSYEYETTQLNQHNNPWNNNVPFPFPNYGLQSSSLLQQQQESRTQPTIIRAQPAKLKNSIAARKRTECDQLILAEPPMPSLPPPSPPLVTDIHEACQLVSPFGVVLYDYVASQTGDLSLKVNDIVYLLRRVDKEWLYGKVDDREGMFPANFIDVQVPLQTDQMTKGAGTIVTALYSFSPQMPGDLELKPGQLVKVMKILSDDWYLGESNGLVGQFPSAFVSKVPSLPRPY